MESPEIVTDFHIRDKQTLDKQLNEAVKTAIPLRRSPNLHLCIRKCICDNIRPNR